MKFSEKYIIDIRTFIANYYMIEYNFEGVLTHEAMFELFHYEKQRIKTMRFSEVSKELVLTGECILVIDEEGKVIPYRNPLRRNFQIEDLKEDSKKLEEIRRNLLMEQGLTYDKNGNVVPLKKECKLRRLFINGGKR